MGLNQTVTRVKELKNRALVIVKAADAEGSLLFKEIGQLFHDLLSLGQDETKAPTVEPEEVGPEAKSEPAASS